MGKKLEIPVSVALSCVEMLQAGAEGAQREQAAMARRGVLQMYRTIEQFWLLEELRAGQVELEAENLSAAGLLLGVTREADEMFQERNVTLKVQVNVGVTARADQEAVRQALWILLEKRLRASRSGDTVTVTAQRTPWGTQIGVSGGAEPWMEDDDETEIVRELVRLHGSELRTEGSDASFRLPAVREHYLRSSKVEDRKGIPMEELERGSF